METGGKVQSFENMTVWQESINLAVDIYKITNDYPQNEQFAITTQIRRAATSISANIAEGFGRFGVKEKGQFYKIAYGSLLEVKSFLYLSEKIGYINKSQLNIILDNITLLQKRINSLISSLNKRM